MLAAALAAISLQAQIVFDAGRDFSTNQNPNGAWSYGWWEAGNRHFELFTGSRPLSELDASSSPRIWDPGTSRLLPMGRRQSPPSA